MKRWIVFFAGIICWSVAGYAIAADQERFKTASEIKEYKQIQTERNTLSREYNQSYSDGGCLLGATPEGGGGAFYNIDVVTPDCIKMKADVDRRKGELNRFEAIWNGRRLADLDARFEKFRGSAEEDELAGASQDDLNKLKHELSNLQTSIQDHSDSFNKTAVAGLTARANELYWRMWRLDRDMARARGDLPRPGTSFRY